MKQEKISAEVTAFITRGDQAQQELYKKLQQHILEMYPEVETRFSYGIPTYKVQTGKVWLGYWKGGVSLYTGFPALITGFVARHPNIKSGKGCLNFRLTDHIPWEDVFSLIRTAMGSGKV